MIEALWTEKYRPKELEDFYGRGEVVRLCRTYIAEKSIPHLLLVGPEGSGKKSLSLVLAKKILGDWFTHNFKAWDASDYGGVILVKSESDWDYDERKKAEERGIISLKDITLSRKIGDAPYRIIFIDNAHLLNLEAQQGFRALIEKNFNNCRFILSCSAASRLIIPLRSRTVRIAFTPTTFDNMFKILKDIADKERIGSKDGHLLRPSFQLIYQESNYNLSKAINLLQASAAIDASLMPNSVQEVISSVKSQNIKQMIKYVGLGNFLEARKYLSKVMYDEGLSGLDIIKQIMGEIENSNIPSKKKMQLISLCGDHEFRLIQSQESYYQIEALLANMMVVLVEKNQEIISY